MFYTLNCVNLASSSGSCGAKTQWYLYCTGFHCTRGVVVTLALQKYTNKQLMNSVTNAAVSRDVHTMQY